MKTITLQQAFKILEDCSAIIIDQGSHTVLYPGLTDLTGEDENEFLCLSWQDEEGQEYREAFLEGANRKVTIEKSSMFLIDGTNAEEFQLTVLMPQNLEKV